MLGPGAYSPKLTQPIYSQIQGKFLSGGRDNQLIQRTSFLGPGSHDHFRAIPDHKIKGIKEINIISKGPRAQTAIKARELSKISPLGTKIAPFYYVEYKRFPNS